MKNRFIKVKVVIKQVVIDDDENFVDKVSLGIIDKH